MVDASISLVVGAAGWLIGFPFEDCCWSPNYRAAVLLATRDARAGGTQAFPGRGACRQPGGGTADRRCQARRALVRDFFAAFRPGLLVEVFLADLLALAADFAAFFERVAVRPALAA